MARSRKGRDMAVTAFHDFPLAPRDRKWDGAAAEKRVRAWADADSGPSPGLAGTGGQPKTSASGS
jgi:hypothetical protein